jgi:hypothetical protein
MPSPAICRRADPAEQIAAQRAAIARFEAALWDGGFNQNLLASYQSAWRRLEALLERSSEDRRHHFVLIIPVADSPVHLHNCLASLLELCRAFGYGGQHNGRWRKLSLLLADDSGDAASIARHRAIAAGFEQQGIATHYFGLEEQLALMDRFDGLDLTPIVGKHARDAFHHKGQAMMRNIAYLKCAELAQTLTDQRVLFYTLDADQTFKVNVETADGPCDVLAINYLAALDEVFSHTEAQILTGKVVGDPPVSPAVMASNFLEDVLAFLNEMAAAHPAAAYLQPDSASSGDAAYHDMADLFGFQRRTAAYRYRCAADAPNNSACFSEFAGRLNRFFHGEHPTRVTGYEYADVMSSVTPARTVYTGNYVFRASALNCFIPFAPLRLRMSGPTMGRMLQTSIGAGFVSANLPMLHRRTLDGTGQSEFRPGVVDDNAGQRVDLCGEFERQFHGDVMLFSMQRFAALGYPDTALATEQVEATLRALQDEMRATYHTRQLAILERLEQLKARLGDPACWWNRNADFAFALRHFQVFLDNIEHNFGTASICFAHIDDPARNADWRARQLAAITGFHANRQVWAEALGRQRSPSD